MEYLQLLYVAITYSFAVLPCGFENALKQIYTWYAAAGTENILLVYIYDVLLTACVPFFYSTKLSAN